MSTTRVSKASTSPATLAAKRCLILPQMMVRNFSFNQVKANPIGCSVSKVEPLVEIFSGQHLQITD